MEAELAILLATAISVSILHTISGLSIAICGIGMVFFRMVNFAQKA